MPATSPYELIGGSAYMRRYRGENVWILNAVYNGLLCITSIYRVYGNWGDADHCAVNAMGYSDRCPSYEAAEYGLYAGSRHYYHYGGLRYKYSTPLTGGGANNVRVRGLFLCGQSADDSTSIVKGEFIRDDAGSLN